MKVKSVFAGVAVAGLGLGLVACSSGGGPSISGMSCDVSLSIGNTNPNDMADLLFSDPGVCAGIDNGSNVPSVIAGLDPLEGTVSGWQTSTESSESYGCTWSNGKSSYQLWSNVSQFNAANCGAGGAVLPGYTLQNS